MFKIFCIQYFYNCFCMILLRIILKKIKSAINEEQTMPETFHITLLSHS